MGLVSFPCIKVSTWVFTWLLPLYDNIFTIHYYVWAYIVASFTVHYVIITKIRYADTIIYDTHIVASFPVHYVNIDWKYRLSRLCKNLNAATQNLAGICLVVDRWSLEK